MCNKSGKEEIALLNDKINKECAKKDDWDKFREELNNISESQVE